jgi:hypothetical protein
MKNELVALNTLVSNLRDNLEGAEMVRAEYRTLEAALSEERTNIERLSAETAQLQSQMVQIELTRDHLYVI